MKRDIKIIFLDQDGTLLSSEKEISPANYAALESAAAKGILIVPCTGRFFGSIPEQIRALPFLRYFITLNGAEVYDAKENRSLHSALISLPKVNEIFSVLDTLPVIYDCFQDNWCWTDQKFYDILEEFARGDLRVDQMRKLRTPLENLQKVIRERNKPVQKIQMFFQDMDLRAKMLKELPRRFPDLTITTAIVNNIEFNSGDAHKGAAMLELCRLLDIDPTEAMACGDGLNDITMLQSAGIGVAMDNAPEEVKAVADFITDTNDYDGVAKAIAHFCLT